MTSCVRRGSWAVILKSEAEYSLPRGIRPWQTGHERQHHLRSCFLSPKSCFMKIQNQNLRHFLMHNLYWKQSYIFLDIGYEGGACLWKSLDCVWENQNKTGGHCEFTSHRDCPYAWPRSLPMALSIWVPANKLKNMQTSEFTQQFRHSWGITENYFESIQ